VGLNLNIVKNLLTLIIILTIFSCSINKRENCTNRYYVYKYDECSCTIDDDNCHTYYLLNEVNYNCQNTFLLESSDSCVFFDNTICDALNFSGYIRVLEKNCLKSIQLFKS